MNDFVMDHAARRYGGDAGRFRAEAVEAIDRARGLLAKGDHGGATNSLFKAVKCIHRSFMMQELGLAYGKCAGWYREEGEGDETD